MNSRGGSRRLTVYCADGQSFAVDDVVFAASGPGTLQLLNGIPASGAEQSALSGIEFHHASLALHTDPIYAPVNAMYWSFLNCQLQGTSFCEASMWLADVVTGVPPTTAAKLWKSWTTHRLLQPTQVLHQADFMHMLPTPASIQAQTDTRQLQGKTGLWFAGGFLFPYDAQETALLSAIEVANGLNGGSTPRGDALLPRSSLDRGASPLGLLHTLSRPSTSLRTTLSLSKGRSPLRRLAPFAWLARCARSRRL